MSIERRYPTLKHNHGVADLRDVDLSTIEDGETLVWDEAQQKFVPGVATGGGGGGSAPDVIVARGATWSVLSGSLLVPANDVALPVTQDATITKVVVLGQGGTGSVEIDVWRTTPGAFPATAADSIVGGNYPAIVSDDNDVDTTLTGWSTAVSAGDVLVFHLRSVSIFQIVTVYVELTPVDYDAGTVITNAQIQAVAGAMAASTPSLALTYDPIAQEISGDVLAAGTAYDNTTSGLTATTVQDAIDELSGGGGGAGTSGTFTGTLTGVTGTVTGTVYWERLGDVVVLRIPQLLGTSNTTACSITGLPSALWPAQLQRPLIDSVFSNSVYVGQPTMIRVETTGELTLDISTVTPSGFSNTGTKGINYDGQVVVYSLA